MEHGSINQKLLSPLSFGRLTTFGGLALRFTAIQLTSSGALLSILINKDNRSGGVLSVGLLICRNS
jgi:hypothetical protein